MRSGCFTWERVHKWTGKVESCLISFHWSQDLILCARERKWANTVALLGRTGDTFDNVYLSTHTHTHTHTQMDFIGDKITANSWQWIVITQSDTIGRTLKDHSGDFVRFWLFDYKANKWNITPKHFPNHTTASMCHEGMQTQVGQIFTAALLWQHLIVSACMCGN